MPLSFPSCGQRHLKIINPLNNQPFCTCHPFLSGFVGSPLDAPEVVSYFVIVHVILTVVFPLEPFRCAPFWDCTTLGVCMVGTTGLGLWAVVCDELDQVANHGKGKASPRCEHD